MALVNVGKVASFVVNGPPVDISGMFPTTAQKRILTRFADLPGATANSLRFRLFVPIKAARS